MPGSERELSKTMLGSERELNKAQCTQLLKAALKCEQVVLLGFELQGLGGNLGFMGEHLKLRVKYQLAGEVMERSFFVKRTPSDERHRNYVVGDGLFAKEREMYENLLPLMCRHLGVSKLPVPEFYLVSEGHFLVLEDLAAAGFTMQDKLLPLDVEFCHVAMRAIAKFHAGSLAIEARTGETVTKFSKHHAEVLLVGENSASIAHLWHQASLSTMLGVLQKLNVYRRRLEGRWEEVRKRLKEAWNKSSELASTPSTKFRNVLCHGDLWVNNVLFRRDHSGEVCDATLVDFQIFRHVPPALDLVMFLHTTSTRELREQHLLQLLLTYHDQLTRTLHAAGLQEHVVSLEELMRSVHEYRFFGVVVTARYFLSCLKTDAEVEETKRERSRDASISRPGSEFLIDRSDAYVRGLDKYPARRDRVLQAIDQLLDCLNL